MLKMSDENVVKLVTKSISKNSALRDKALKNGNAAVEEIFGTIEPMKGVKVIFHENTDAEVHIALPPRTEVSRDLDSGQAEYERGLADWVAKGIGLVEGGKAFYAAFTK